MITTGRAEGCDLRLLAQRFDADGQELLFAWGGKTHKVRLDLIGGFQAANALVSAGLAIGAGSDPAAVIGVLPGLRTVRGRMERAARRANGALVFVDYAHTPDALTTALTALRPHVMGRLVVVFGAGGDRDRGKRPLMGAAAAKAADLVYVTDDNPRTEDPGGDPRRGPGRRPRGDRGRRPRRGDPDRDRRAAAGRRALDRRQGPRDRPDRRPGHPALRRRRAGERRRRGAGRPRRMRMEAPPAIALPLWTRDAAAAATGGRSGRDWAATGRLDRQPDPRPRRPLRRARRRARRPRLRRRRARQGRRGRAGRRAAPKASRPRRPAPRRPRGARGAARPRRRGAGALRGPRRRRHRLGRQDRHQGDAEGRAGRPGPDPRRREELQQPLGRAADPRPPAGDRRLRGDRDRHERPRRDRAARPPRAAARRDGHHRRGGPSRRLPRPRRHRPREGLDRPGPGARRRRRAQPRHPELPDPARRRPPRRGAGGPLRPQRPARVPARRGAHQ